MEWNRMEQLEVVFKVQLPDHVRAKQKLQHLLMALSECLLNTNTHGVQPPH